MPPTESRFALIGEDTAFEGRIQNGGRIEVKGYFEGELQAQHVLVHKTGRIFGTVRADSAEVHGRVQGTVGVKKLITISSTGEVAGNVRYGQLSVKEGGHLIAEVRNVPPELAGDFNVVVRRGRNVRVTTDDVTANDPDDKPEDLHFTITNPVGGHLALRKAPETPVLEFTQAELQAGDVFFIHGGGSDKRASFDVRVTDKAGAGSGPPRTVSVDVI